MKKALLISILICSLYANLFPKMGLYLGFTSLFGLSGSTTTANKIFPEEFRNFDTGFTFNIGLKHSLNNILAYSVLLDLGYYHDSYEFKYETQEYNSRIVESYQFENFLVGLLTRFHLSFFSIGVGGGAKIPTMGYYSKEGLTERNRYFLSYGDMNDIFDHVVIPYLKLTLDFSILNYLLLGAYVNYDFPISIKPNNYLSENMINKLPMSGLDIGIQFGYFISFYKNN